MRQNVKREQRLAVGIILRFPNINRGKSYTDSSRKYRVVIDGVESYVVGQNSYPFINLNLKLCSQVTVTKTYGSSNRPDSIFTFIVRENFATLTNQSGFTKRVELDFSGGNEIMVLDDNDYIKAIDIS